MCSTASSQRRLRDDSAPLAATRPQRAVRCAQCAGSPPSSSPPRRHRGARRARPRRARRRRPSGARRSCASSTATPSACASTAAPSACATSASTPPSRSSPARRWSASPSARRPPTPRSWPAAQSASSFADVERRDHYGRLLGLRVPRGQRRLRRRRLMHDGYARTHRDRAQRGACAPTLAARTGRPRKRPRPVRTACAMGSSPRAANGLYQVATEPRGLRASIRGGGRGQPPAPASGSTARLSSAWTRAGATACAKHGSMRFVLLIFILLASRRRWSRWRCSRRCTW